MEKRVNLGICGGCVAWVALAGKLSIDPSRQIRVQQLAALGLAADFRGFGKQGRLRAKAA